METSFNQQEVRTFLMRRAYIPFLCLAVTFPVACSFDERQLRASSSPSPDGVVDSSTGSDTVDGIGVTEQPDRGTTQDVSAIEVATIVDVAVTDNRASASDAIDSVLFRADQNVARDADGLDDVPTLLDLASEAEVADAPSTDDVTGTGGMGGCGTGGSIGSGGTSGSTASGGTGGTSIDNGAGGAGGDPDLVLWYRFDESTGTTAADSALWGGIARNATLTTFGTGGTAVFTTVSQVGTHAVVLTPATAAANANGGYVTVPSVQSLAPTAITLAVWVNLAANTSTQNWERIFDFGTGSMTYMYLTARASDAPNTPVRFAITTKGNPATAEQRLDGTSMLSESVWHHLAVVLPAGPSYTGTLYIDGVAIATNNAMTLHASDLGATTRNWLGRSQFSGTAGTNPCFNGLLDDFRVYKRALSQQEIATLFALR